MTLFDILGVLLFLFVVALVLHVILSATNPKQDDKDDGGPKAPSCPGPPLIDDPSGDLIILSPKDGTQAPKELVPH